MREWICSVRAPRDELVIDKVSDEDVGAVKETLIKNVGTGSIPVIKVEDSISATTEHCISNITTTAALLLEYAEKTLAFATACGRDACWNYPAGETFICSVQ